MRLNEMTEDDKQNYKMAWNILKIKEISGDEFEFEVTPDVLLVFRKRMDKKKLLEDIESFRKKLALQLSTKPIYGRDGLVRCDRCMYESQLVVIGVGAWQGSFNYYCDKAIKKIRSTKAQRRRCEKFKPKISDDDKTENWFDRNGKKVSSFANSTYDLVEDTI